MELFLFAQGVDGTAAIQGAQQVAQQISAQEWLGPLAAIALSPFFGIAFLSGVATFGPSWLQERSALMGPSSPFNNPMLFWCMLGLTIATSLPRLTKVSKPIALAAEKLEAYSAVIILIAMRFMPGNESPKIVMADELLIAGWTSVPIDLAFGIAAAINVIVINTIKLTIELLVWLTPIPTIDAWLEIANKSFCLSLMALYTYSPFLSLLLNVLIFAICIVVFSKGKRYLSYAMDLYMMPVLEQLLMMQTVHAGQFVGFLTQPWSGNAAKTRLLVTRVDEEGYRVSIESLGWFARQNYEGTLIIQECRPGLLNDQVTIQVNETKLLLDVRRGLSQQLAAETESENKSQAAITAN